MSDRIVKMVAVVFLTLLIWAWAYLSLEREITKSGTLSILPDTRQDLFVDFVDRQTPVRVNMTLKGPNSKVAELSKKLQTDDKDPTKEKLDFFYNVESENQTQPGRYTFDVLGFLRNNDRLKNLGLRVVDCDVKTIDVNITGLVKMTLKVECKGETGLILKHETIDPPTVSLFVRPEWVGPATVTLTQTQIEQARNGYVLERPYVELAPGKRAYAERVRIRLPSTQERLQEKPLQLTRIGFVFSENLQGKYKAELLNESDLVSTINIEASVEAFDAFDKMRYQILVEVRDTDENAEDVISRDVIYNFPSEYVRKNEIKLTGPPRPAKFKLVSVPAPPAGSP